MAPRGATHRARVLGGRLTALGLVVALAVTGCAKEPSESEIVSSLRKAGVSKPVAECLADAFESLPDADRKRIAQAGANGVVDDTKVDGEPIDEARKKMSACRDAGTTTTTTSPAGP